MNNEFKHLEDFLLAALREKAADRRPARVRALIELAKSTRAEIAAAIGDVGKRMDLCHVDVAKEPNRKELLEQPGMSRFSSSEGGSTTRSAAEAMRPEFMVESVHPDDLAAVRQNIERAAKGEIDDSEIEFRLKAKDGRWLWMRAFNHATSAGSERVSHSIMLDVTEQKRMQEELQEAQKLESVGRLASGIAHEINTPVQFVNDNVHFLQASFEDLARLLKFCRETLREIANGSSPEWLSRLETLETETDVDFVLGRAPTAFSGSIDGLGRVAELVRSMKEFAHPDQAEKTLSDINHALATTLAIARNEYKYVADLETDFGDLPRVRCKVNQLNQVFLNLLVNAAHAIGDVVKGTETRGRIQVRTRLEDNEVVISIGDTGGGIPEAIRAKVFEPFFTTKEVGKGTGQGLAIARSVVVEKHGGRITFESTVGKGTTFVIHLPIDEQSALGDTSV